MRPCVICGGLELTFTVEGLTICDGCASYRVTVKSMNEFESIVRERPAMVSFYISGHTYKNVVEGSARAKAYGWPAPSFKKWGRGYRAAYLTSRDTAKQMAEYLERCHAKRDAMRIRRALH